MKKLITMMVVLLTVSITTGLASPKAIMKVCIVKSVVCVTGGSAGHSTVLLHDVGISQGYQTIVAVSQKTVEVKVMQCDAVTRQGNSIAIAYLRDESNKANRVGKNWQTVMKNKPPQHDYYVLATNAVNDPGLPTAKNLAKKMISPQPISSLAAISSARTSTLQPQQVTSIVHSDQQVIHYC